MLYIILGIIVVLVLAIVALYNGLVKSKVRVDEAWSDITVQLKRRYDLIPNLVETVKGYAKHEKGTFEAVIAARNQAMTAKGVADTAKAENMIEGTLKNLFALTENYPDLKANQNFLDLQAQLVDTEDKIQSSRRYYNSSVRDYNTKTMTIPTSLFAGILGFSQREFFEVEETLKAEIQKPVDVKFE